MRRPVKRARAKRGPSANPSPPQMPNPLPAAVHPPGNPRGTRQEHDTKALVLMRKTWVMRLIVGGLSVMKICDAVAEARTPEGVPIPIDGSEVRAIYSEYLKELQLENAANIPAARVVQLDQIRNAMARILQGDVVLYQGVPVPAVRKVNWGAYFQAHREYSLIMGTHAPKVIELNTDNNIAHAMNRLLQNMDPADYERLADEAEQGLRVHH